MNLASYRHWYFSLFSLFCLLVAIVGFWDNLVSDIHQPSNSDPKFIVHGMLCLGWMVSFALQANLIRLKQVGLHRRLGNWGFLVGLGVVISTLWVFIAVWKGWDAMPDFVRANRLLMLTYAIAIGLSWHWRSRPALHKRLAAWATLFMQMPILDRALPDSNFTLPLWLAMIASLFVYDLALDRKIHTVTLAGLAAWGSSFAVAVLALPGG